MSPPLASLAVTQGGIFTAGDARAHGYGPHEVAGLVQRGAWTRLRRGVYAEAPPKPARLPEMEVHRLLVRASLALVADTCASHTSAATLLGISLLHAPTTVTLTSPTADHRKRDGLHVLHAPLPPVHRLVVAGLPSTSGARTAVDVARTTSFVSGVVAMDSVLHTGRATRAEVEQALACARGWPGVRAAARAFAFSDARSESPGESWARVVMAQAGLPLPVPQMRITGLSGALYRGDLVLEEQRVVVEFDGVVKYDAQDQSQARAALLAEKRREDDIRAMGWSVVRLEWADLSRPDWVRHKVENAVQLGPGARRR